MNILAIDTSSEICGLSIEKDNIIKTYDRNGNLQHSVLLPYLVDEAIQDSDLKIENLDYVVVSNGPGSYTGLRIGVSFAIGLTTTNNIPIIYIDTLEQNANNINIKKDSFILSIIDAKVGRVYAAIFDNNKNRLCDDCILSIDELIKLINKYIVNKNIVLHIIGDAVYTYAEKFKVFKNKKNIMLCSKKYNKNNTKSLIYASHKYIKKGNFNREVNINYMQVSQAERNLKK